jgi:hypothetical protein
MWSICGNDVWNETVECWGRKAWCDKLKARGAVAQLGARLDGIEEVVGSNPIGSTI